MDLQIGQVIREYTIIRRLGEGGMATVFLAQHRLLKNEFAVKVLKGGQADLKERMHREGIVQFQLTHPNIVKLTDMFEEDNNLFLVMEYANGESLEELLQHKMPLDRCIEVFTQIVTGVAFAHERGIVHRDLKPANIMFQETENGSVAKVADFGLVKIVGTEGLTQSGIAMGTPAYMSPEQVERKDLKPTSDVFSLGQGGNVFSLP